MTRCLGAPDVAADAVPETVAPPCTRPRCLVFGLCVLAVAVTGCRHEPPRLLRQGDPLGSASAWTETFPQVVEHPQLGRAREIFERLRETVGTHAELLVLEVGSSPRALALPDETVILSRSGLDFSYDSVPSETGDARLAFLFGHELTHVANDDFWHASAVATVGDVDDETEILKRLEELLAQDGKDRQVMELRADEAGVLALIQAGFDPTPLLDGRRTFFEEWTGGTVEAFAYADASHPSPADRAEFLRGRLADVARRVEPHFRQGVAAFRRAEALAAAGSGRASLPVVEAEYLQAIEHFDRFRRHFEGREVLNNLALAHLRLASARLAACDGALINRYYLPTVLDPVTLAERARNRGAVGHSSTCFGDRVYQDRMTTAIRLLETAVERDRAYLPARLNLVAAYVIDERTSSAAFLAIETAEMYPEDPRVAAVWGAANLAYSTTETSIADPRKVLERIEQHHRAFPDDPAIAFNLASGLTHVGRLHDARPIWKAFLELEPGGPWADMAREWVAENRQADAGGGAPH